MKIIIHYTTKTIVIAGAVLVLVIAAGALFVRQSPKPTSPLTATKTAVPPSVPEEEGDMQVDVAHNQASTATTHQFTVTLNTHSGDLSTFDAQTNVVYRTEKGQEVPPQSVGGDKETHHRTIAVTFASVSLPGTVVIKNLRGVPERSFPIK